MAGEGGRNDAPASKVNLARLGLPRRNPRDWFCFRLDYRCSHVGVVVSVGAAILGQMLGSFLVDTFGWFGVTKIPFDPLRLLGIALLVAGLLLFRENRRAQAPRIKDLSKGV